MFLSIICTTVGFQGDTLLAFRQTDWYQNAHARLTNFFRSSDYTSICADLHSATGNKTIYSPFMFEAGIEFEIIGAL